MNGKTSSPANGHDREEVSRKLTQAWARTLADKKLTQVEFASKTGCDKGTIKNALGGGMLPGLNTVLNSLLVCPNALDEVLRLYGFRIIPNDLAMCPDMQTLFEMSRALTGFVQALDDGRRDHRETLELAELLRPVVPKLTAIIHEAEGLRSVAA